MARSRCRRRSTHAGRAWPGRSRSRSPPNSIRLEVEAACEATICCGRLVEGHGCPDRRAVDHDLGRLGEPRDGLRRVRRRAFHRSAADRLPAHPRPRPGRGPAADRAHQGVVRLVPDRGPPRALRPQDPGQHLRLVVAAQVERRAGVRRAARAARPVRHRTGRRTPRSTSATTSGTPWADSPAASARSWCCASWRTSARPRPPACSASPPAPSRARPARPSRSCGSTPRSPPTPSTSTTEDDA